MSRTPNTRSITSYFQPATKGRSTPPHPTTRPQNATPSSSLTPPPPTSPIISPALNHPSSITPSRPRALEIGASDDDGDDDDGASSSSGSLADLSALLGLARPAPPSISSTSQAVPPAKLRAPPDFLFSRGDTSRKHKFDLAALAEDARIDAATEASAKRAKAAAAKKPSPAGPPPGAGRGVIEHIVNGSNSTDAQRVLRTVQRADLAIPSWYCFFDRDYRVPPSSPAPKLPEGSPWRLLTHKDLLARERNLASGVPQNILIKQGGLPDDVFTWILDELCVSKSSLSRQEYCNILVSCRQQVERLVTPARLESLFRRLGATEELGNMEAELTISKPSHEPYQGHDWSCVISFLILLDMLSGSLSLESTVYASRVLLRMALDRTILHNIDLFTVFEDTLVRLLGAIPASSWDSFCFDTCSLLHANIKHPLIRTHALLCLSVRDPASHDLRRRLATTYLFDDPSMSRLPPDETITIRLVIQRTAQADFAISSAIDFAELQARLLLLDMVISHGAAPTPLSSEAEAAFNKDVDELAARLGAMDRKINGSGMKVTQTEVKGVLEWVQQRLVHSVRTRRPIAKSIFDMYRDGVDDSSLPRQREMMQAFLQRAPREGAQI